VGHLDEDALLAFVQHMLSPEALAQAEAHLRSCNECRRAVALLAETEAGPPDPTPLPPKPMHAPRPVGAARPARKGKQIDRYVVLDVLGAGSMGIVYAAFDPQLDRKIALKMLAGDSGDDAEVAEKRARMMREAQAMARLSHPNVVHVHDVGTFQDQIFVAMELIQGQSLTKWLESEKRTWRDILRVFIRAGHGLAAAHAAGLVHRDFKPDNVVVGNDGVARVMDFGLVSAPAAGPSAWNTPAPIPAVRASASAAADLGTPITRTGVLLGTPAYMAPEQWTGIRIDHRADQFSFCVSLYEALYGQRPFEGRTLSELTTRVSQGKIRDVPPGSPVPFYIRRAVTRGLAADPKLRHPSMPELLKALELGLRVPRRRVLFASGAAVLLVAGGVLGGPALWQLRSQERCGGAADAFAEAWTRARAPALSPHAQRQVDRFRERWVAARERVCRAAADPATRLREACLDGQLDELRALGEVLGRADAKVARRAAMAAAGLPSPEVCSEERGLAADIALEPSAAERAFRHQLALARASLAAGDLAGARMLAVGVLDAGSGTNAALRAEAWLALGATAAGEDAQRSFGKAMASAEESGHLHAGAEAAVAAAERLGDGPQAEFYLNMSAAGLDRLGAHGPLRARVELATARRLLAQRRPEAAEVPAKRALDILRRLYGEDHPEVARALEVLAQVEAQRGRPQEALAHQRAALVALERALGLEDPALASALLGLSRTERALGEVEVADAHCRRAVRLGAAADCAAMGRGGP
jgi:hypothetical protein